MSQVDPNADPNADPDRAGDSPRGEARSDRLPATLTAGERRPLHESADSAASAETTVTAAPRAAAPGEGTLADGLETTLAVAALPVVAVVLLAGQFYLATILLVLIAVAAVALLVRRRRRAVSAPSRGVLVVGNLLVLLLALSTLLWAGETYYRFVYDQTDSFSLTLTSQQFVARHYPANNWGLCDNVDYTGPADPTRRRLTFLGDSFTVGYGLADIDQRFVNRIRAGRGGEWEIQSFAQIGADSADQLRDLRYFVDERNVHLDTAVLAYCLNDISDITPQWQATLERMLQQYKEELPFPLDQSYFLNLYYFRLYAARDPAVANYYSDLIEAYDGEIWDVQAQRLRDFAAFCREREAGLLVVIFPFLQRLGAEYPFAAAHEKVARLFAEEQVPTIDLRPLYERYDEEELRVSIYDAHPNAFAHQLAAEAITTLVLENMGPPRTSAPQPAADMEAGTGAEAPPGYSAILE